ncbi:MAG TPA: YggS family pyridoxal phosphate-dependent enzyme [Ignavibacteriaceae bacterium]|nr:YggS family pyridoxal phosphate-dependent enzyme [Ignavibacteriaceae bacterium]
MIADNLHKVRERIAEVCAKNGRNPNEVTLIAVSKNFGIEEIEEAKNTGQIVFGENRAQELTQKYEVIGNNVVWHFIGSLQRNKVRFAVNAAEYIHSVDSFLLASEINKYAAKQNKIQKILLQFKTTNEDSKQGITSESELRDLALYCKEFKNIQLVGLMTIGPLTEDKDEIKKSFRYLSEMKLMINNEGLDLKELSMGMTNDYDIAIEEGATMVRIGSAIFGYRDYSKQ